MMVVKTDPLAWVAIGPEKNKGVLVTGAVSGQIRGILIMGGGWEVGRKFPHKARIGNPDERRFPDSEYNKHRELAESAFSSRKKRKEKKAEMLSSQARMF